MKIKLLAAMILILLILSTLTLSTCALYDDKSSSTSNEGFVDGYYKLLTADGHLDLGKIFLFEKVDHSTYRISNFKTNKVLTAAVLGLSEENWRQEDSQKWIIQNTAFGSTLQSKSNLTYILCEKEDLVLKPISYEKLLPTISVTSNAQYFILLPMFDTVKDSQKKNSINSERHYQIQSLSTERVLAKNHSEVILSSKSVSDSKQCFKLIKNSDGTYTIRSMDSFILGIDRASSKISFAKESENLYEKWQIEVYDQRIVFRNTANQQVLAINGKGEVTAGSFDFTAATLWDICELDNALIKTPKPFKYFAQNDPAWSEEPYSWAKMRNAGCGPTSLSMITNYLSEKDANPLIIARISKRNNLDIKEPPRTDMDKLVAVVTKEFGLSYKKIDKKEIINELKQGRLVMMATWANKKIKYSGHGHFLVLRGLDKKGSIIVNDPLAMNTYGTKAESYVENYKEKYVYVAKPDDLFEKLFLAYSFW